MEVCVMEGWRPPVWGPAVQKMEDITFGILEMFRECGPNMGLSKDSVVASPVIAHMGSSGYSVG